MKRLLVLGIGLCFVSAQPAAAADSAAAKKAREALQEFNDFIGGWKGSGGLGTPERPKPDSKGIWKESIDWGWRFKGDDAWLTMTVTDGKYFRSGELRFLPDKKAYQLTVANKQDQKLVFEGELKKGRLTLVRIDPKTKDTQQLEMNLAGDGVRFIYRFATKPEGRTIFTPEYYVALNKEGESIGAKDKKNECVVTGGLGTIPVSFKGMTYYVCCTGCREAFMENPEKIIKEYLARKGKK